ncbi:YEATS domain-containing protein 4 [Nematocida displodere]|uniref:Protein AF-9 homolog n=1 Tax=Nematocida displodere TaxID=1805483 RepID=A0A177EJI4_9MICR|nr:YEATS domain-containing protein 4 [Nematocida displodere]
MRINHANLAQTIIYGTVAERINEPDNPATHRWRVYVRGYKNTDISYFIRSITFKVHETFSNPTRIIDTPPFEVEECGWGEFGIQGKIYFVDVHEKPVYFMHGLKLHMDSTVRVVGDIEYPPNAICNERMDTIIFESPTETMYKLIKSNPEPVIDPEIAEAIYNEKKRIEKAIDFVIEKLEREGPK